MTEHLPECPVEKMLRSGRTVGSQSCICEHLRACEDRVARAFHVVRKDDTRKWEKFSLDQFDAGFSEGLDAAREAVASISGQGVFVPRIYKHVALTAIDALKEKP